MIAVFGPGIVVMLADTDVGSIITAGQSGVQWGYRHSLELHPLKARWFYGMYAACVVAGAVLVWAWPNLVSLNIGVQVMNALLLPLVLGFLIALAVRALPEPYRLKGFYLWLVIIVSAVTTGLGVFGGLQGMGLF
ncbi:MAG: hypothetical protein WCD70_10300 [Alphaproteobacteria bacterium]